MSPLKVIGGGLLAALVFFAVWLPSHQPEPLLPTADLYTHLTVARHLVRGEGFQTDIAYPLSFAFPFARQLPQPLIHRGPGYPVLLSLPYRLAGQDPAATIKGVRIFQLTVLGLIVLTGAVAFLRRGQLVNLAPWLVLLAANPLLVFAVDWGFEELVISWLLLMLWIRNRSGQTPGWVDGILAGMMATIRLDLIWLPVLWWLWFYLERKSLTPASERQAGKGVPRILVAVGLMLIIQLPWAGRNIQLTGQPFFTLQAQAELVKDTRTWPLYSVYKQLEPQPVARTLAQDPVPVLRKTARGLKFYFTNAPRLLPVPFLLLAAMLIFVLLRGKITHLPCPFRKGREEPMSILAEDTVLGPLAAASLSAVLLVFQYSLFDHSLRHLLVVVPILAWEFAPLTGTLGADLVAKRYPRWAERTNLLAAMATSVLVTGLVVWISYSPLSGWQKARQQARDFAPQLAVRTQIFEEAGPLEIFVSESALPWYADRPGVWDPDNESTRQTIRDYLIH